MKTLDELLENWTVHHPYCWENNEGPTGWYAVSNDKESIIAYFAKEKDAFRWRLFMINRELNR